MDTFVKRYQPDRFPLWKLGKDIAPHPEDDQKKLYKYKAPAELTPEEIAAAEEE